MQETESRIKTLIIEINSFPSDRVTQDARLLWTWGTELAALLSTLSPALIQSQRDYQALLSQHLRQTQTKAAAEIHARDSDIWQRKQVLEYLYHDGEKMLQLVKRFMKLLEEERRNQMY